MNIERAKRETLMAHDIPDECECDYADDTGPSYCVACIARAWRDEHEALREAATRVGEMLDNLLKNGWIKEKQMFEREIRENLAALRRVQP